jgi:hypothetical protein
MLHAIEHWHITLCAGTTGRLHFITRKLHCQDSSGGGSLKVGNVGIVARERGMILTSFFDFVRSGRWLGAERLRQITGIAWTQHRWMVALGITGWSVRDGRWGHALADLEAQEWK